MEAYLFNSSEASELSSNQCPHQIVYAVRKHRNKEQMKNNDLNKITHSHMQAWHQQRV
jgi:hypothetical protein